MTPVEDELGRPPERDNRPISWCRILGVGPVCERLCQDCTETAQRAPRVDA